jgi:membrane protein implicated in regulation of membrane protease activity
MKLMDRIFIALLYAIGIGGGMFFALNGMVVALESGPWWVFGVLAFATILCLNICLAARFLQIEAWQRRREELREETERAVAMSQFALDA